jgi:hypothetical protein
MNSAPNLSGPGSSIDYASKGHFLILPSGVTPKRANAEQVTLDRDHVLWSDLPICQSGSQQWQLTLLGYALSPLAPEDDDNAILRRLTEAPSLETLLQNTNILGGRWLLIVKTKTDLLILGDATNLRSLYYTCPTDQVPCYCASSPFLLAQQLGLPLDPLALDYIRHSDWSKRHERWWPGLRTPYSKVFQLLPNHLLNVTQGQTTRFWPCAPLPSLTASEAAPKIAQLLKGTMTSAARRFDMTFLITSGWDSRLILAACRDIVQHMTFLSIRTHAGEAEDVETPAIVLPKLGLNHAAVVSSRKPTPAFWNAYRKDSLLKERNYASNAEAIWPHFKGKRVAVTGHDAGIFQNSYHCPPNPTAAQLCQAINKPEHPFLTAVFEQWLHELGDIHNMKFSDIFCWEQKNAKWLSTWMSEYDMVWQDCLVPLNCREILATFLAVPSKERLSRPLGLYQKIMDLLWPDLNKEFQSSEPKIPRRVHRFLARLKFQFGTMGIRLQ